MAAVRSKDVCHSCRSLLHAHKGSSAANRYVQMRGFCAVPVAANGQAQGLRAWRPQLSRRMWTRQPRLLASTVASAPAPQPLVPETHLPVVQGQVEELTQHILRRPEDTKKLPVEKEVAATLKRFHEFAQQLLNERVTAPKTPDKSSGGTATSALLSSVNKKQAKSKITKADILNNISRSADDIVEAPTLFLTPEILNAYVSLQAALKRPQRFPHVLRLYRTKPAPRISSTAPYVTYTNPNPKSPSTAIPPATADAALQGAIALHDLPLCLSVIDETCCTTSYIRSKILRSALFPAAGALLAPVAAFSLASRFALLQNTMDDNYATGVAMAGILTYVSAVGTIGYVALTTSNDQMVRVTWANGMPLWERWIREEERGAIDKVAQAWGFKSVERWGDEEGRDWEELREWIGLRGMVLDKVELMEGME